MTKATVNFPVDPDKVLLAGDWHGNWVRAIEVIRIADERGVEVIVHVGDFGYWTPGLSTDMYLKKVNEACKKAGITLLWVDGNHECHSVLLNQPIDEATGVRRIRSNVYHLPRGFRWTWHGKTWLALGGAVSVDRHMRTENRSWWPEEIISGDDAELAKKGGKADFMVTHDAPNKVFIPGLMSDMFPRDLIYKSELHRDVLGDVVDVVCPDFLFHGHYHVRYVDERPRPDGGVTHVIGLADDGAALSDNFAVISFKEDGYDERLRRDPNLAR